MSGRRILLFPIPALAGKSGCSMAEKPLPRGCSLQRQTS
jgi:hypothetical protein